MDKIIINSDSKLNGEVLISGSKNASLPILMASLLTDEDCVFTNVPKLRDIETTMLVLSHIGKKIAQKDDTVTIKSSGTVNTEAPYKLVSQMRASALVMGPLLARFGKVKASLPGGCAIGARPINIHLEGFKSLGAKVDLEGGYVSLEAQRLKGANIVLDYPSVGATENLLMGSVLGDGITTIENAAREPEVEDLINCLISMGAKISGMGTNTITVEGVEKLKGVNYRVISDRIETGTYMIAATLTKGDVILKNTNYKQLTALISKLEETGVTIEHNDSFIRVKSNGIIKSVNIETSPYPGFPTDMQAQWMVLMSVANGSSLITETVFENRFMQVGELQRMGANLNIKGNSVLVEGVEHLSGAEVMATDLRASAALILAGLVAKGTTTVSRVYHIDRGYERIEEKLKSLGANIRRETEY